MSKKVAPVAPVKKKIMRCSSEPPANKHFDHPYKIGEKVIYMGEVENDGKHAPIYYTQFIKIKRLHPLEDRVEFKKNFTFIN